MPANPDLPEPVFKALTEMEHHVQATKSSLAFAAPELYDLHWGMLQKNLASIITDLYEECNEDK